jgi:Glu-tRNA(Gln) amidotransferase subunit E-like FAD-binding protein
LDIFMDYSKLGFKAGLEIHQQLDTPKLFSGAPSYLRSDEPHYVITRKLHAVAGETGEIDVAVAHEASKDKTFHYEGYHDTISLVELDEDPPKPINDEALDVALQIAFLLNCELYSASQIMRKMVIDGSNTSGFQRTVLIGHSGYVDTSFGRVPIDSVALEEDSARIVTREQGKTVYRLDRLGIPLVEIATAPAMNRPDQVKEAALKIGEILRACKVKRGIGTIRQDVNVSIKGHERVEIKGFQDPAMMITTINKEIERQQNDIQQGSVQGGVRNALPSGESEFLRPLPGRARMYPETDLALLKISLDRINRLRKHLPKLRSDIRDELKKKGLTDELITLVLDTPEALDEFLILVKHSSDATLAAKMVTLWRKEFESKYKKTSEEIRQILSERVLELILEAVKNKKIESGDVKTVMNAVVDGKRIEQALAVEKVDDHALEHEIRAIVKEKPGLRPNAYMGLVIAKLKGKIDAKKAMEILNKIVG